MTPYWEGDVSGGNGNFTKYNANGSFSFFKGAPKVALHLVAGLSHDLFDTGGKGHGVEFL